MDRVRLGIIGTGNIGGTLARHLARGREDVVLAAEDEANAATLAQELGELARATSVEEAIAEADAVLLVVDGRAGLRAGDAELATILQRATTPVLVVANKADRPGDEYLTADFHKLGLGEPLAVSSTQSRPVRPTSNSPSAT